MENELINGAETVDTTTTTENTGDVTPQNNETIETTPIEQSQNKENPANHAFAEQRRKIKDYESKLSGYSQADKEIVDLAKQLGYEGVNGIKDFLSAVKRNTLANQYQETQDPTILAEMMKESIFSDPRFNQTQQNQPQNIDIDGELLKEITDFNNEFGENLKSFDEILNVKNSNKILDYMDKHNLSLKDAYKLANPDLVAEKLAKATKQQTINQVRGLSHVNSNPTASNVDNIQITPSEIAEWKSWFPNKTDEQCRKEIATNKKLFTD